MNIIDSFKSKYEGIIHGNSSYVDHCTKIYNILKNDLNCDEYVCLAGLYHSAYGTEYFDSNITLSKPELKQIIGNKAETLVSLFCYCKDRTNTILNNNLNLDQKTRYDLLCIEYANLIEQSYRLNDQNLNQLCQILFNEIVLLRDYKPRFIKHTINDKNIYVFDDILNDCDIEKINLLCMQSNYTPNHSSNNLHYDLDCRFVSTLNNQALFDNNLVGLMKPIAEYTGLKLDIYNAYINHYTISTSVSKHTDSSEEGAYTVLIFCNKFWENIWGGEIKFYDEKSQIHTLFDYKPGRIIVFDSRIAHQVMPLTTIAKKDRFSIAIKCKLNK